MKLRDKLNPPVDLLGLITPERMAEIRAEARDKVKEKLRKKAEAELLAQEMKSFEQELDPKPEYELRDIIIDAADHTEYLRIDGQQFYYGQKYTVTRPVYDQLVDMLSRGWQHEREISVPSRRVHSMNRGAVLHGAADVSQGSVRF